MENNNMHPALRHLKRKQRHAANVTNIKRAQKAAAKQIKRTK